MVSFCCEIFLLCAAALMLTFFIAGLLFICASSTSITWERTPHPVRRAAFSSHLFTTVVLCCFGGLCEYGAVPERKIIVNIATSADGYIARSDGNVDWLTRRPAPKGF